jgi:hypothetical protein
MVFYHALRLQGKQAAEKQEQLLLYVGGEGGTGKSRIIDAVRLGIGLLGRHREVFVAADTGNGNLNKVVMKNGDRVSGICSAMLFCLTNKWDSRTILRTRNGTVGQSDVDMLNSRVIGELEVRPDRTNTCIVRRNKLRHQINWLQIERFARIRGQQVFIFPAHHAR